MLLSIDVGIRNLALCLMDNQHKILYWDVGSVPSAHEDGLFKSFITHLKNRPWVLTAETILIERQPLKSKTIKSVEHFLHTYFLLMCPNAETIIYDARHKVPDVVGAGKAMYRARKNASIERCLSAISAEGSPNESWIPYFVASKKKDDLADTFMMNMSYERVQKTQKKEKSEKKENVKTKVSPRKPTESQTNTHYSQSNLAWFILKSGKSRETLEKDKRFMKDLKKYYHSYDELLQLLG